MRRLIPSFFIAVLLLLQAAPVHALWPESGINLCELPTTFQTGVQVAPGEDGTVFCVWTDFRSYMDYDIYAQKLDSYGNELWTADGRLLVGGSAYQYGALIISDGAGGFIVMWEYEIIGYETGIKAQRFDSDGNALWTAGGETLVSGSVYNHGQQLIPDGQGGMIGTWYSDATGNYDVYAQRVDADGNVLWGTNGTRLVTDSADQTYHYVCTDGSGGAIVAWYDLRGVDRDIYAQRIDSGGILDWTSDGMEICTETYSQSVSSVVEDGVGGAYILWTDWRATNNDIYAQRVNSYGSAQWTAGGIPVCSAAEHQEDVKGVPDGAGGVVLVWTDSRNYPSDTYAQRLDRDGGAWWTGGGILVSQGPESQIYPQLFVTESEEVIIAWSDLRWMERSTYVQKILLSTGMILWEEGGIQIGGQTTSYENFDLCSDGAGGAMVGWVYDWDASTDDVMVQRVERSGHWGYPAPEIADIRDVPGDQGGSVDVAWYASRLDPWPGMEIESYTLWRGIPHPEAMLMIDGGARVIESVAGLPLSGGLDRVSELCSGSGPDTDIDLIHSPVPDIIRTQILDGETMFWEMIRSIDAMYLETYSAEAATMFDSTASSEEYHYYQLIAHSSKPSAFWISEPDSGYSVDNIAPCPPLALAGEQSFSPEGLELSWSPNTEPDLDCYRVYRGIGPSFDPSPSNLMTEACDTLVFDGGWSWDAGFCYKVTAVDIHGNESDCAVLCEQEITGDDPMPVPDATFLAQNFPNPFNPSTTITFGLKERGRVSLSVYDAAGRLVSTLADGVMDAGRYEISWGGLYDSGAGVASGVYFYRLRAGEFEGTRKMILLR